MAISLPMARPTIKFRVETASTKQKCGQTAKANGTSKHAKKSKTACFLSCFQPFLDSRQKTSQSRDLPFRSAPFQSKFRLFSFLNFITFRFFLLGIGQEVFSIKYQILQFSSTSLPQDLKVFHRLTYRFSSTISRQGFGSFSLTLKAMSTYTLIGAHIKEGKQL